MKIILYLQFLLLNKIHKEIIRHLNIPKVSRFQKMLILKEITQNLKNMKIKKINNLYSNKFKTNHKFSFYKKKELIFSKCLEIIMASQLKKNFLIHQKLIKILLNLATVKENLKFLSRKPLLFFLKLKIKKISLKATLK